MSKPMTAAQWRAQMTKWNVPVEYWPGYDGRGRPARTGQFEDVNGLIVHHTADTNPGDDPYLKFLFEGGRSDLPAPLCHAAGKKDGTIVLGATGRANHAGKGSSTILATVINENYGTGELRPGRSNTDGNARFYGIELCYRGVDGHKPASVQYASAVRFAAAICDGHRWTAKSVIGHREWTTAKIDPGYINMADFRRDVQALLDAGPGTKPAPTPVDHVTAFWTATWNVLGANHRTWHGTRGQAVCDQAAALGVSILATQEVNLGYQAADLKAALSGPFLHAPSRANNDVFYDSAKYDERSATEVALTAFQGRKAHVLEMTRKATGQRFTFVNTHLPSNNPAERESAGRSLAALVRDIKGPVIVTGDLNNTKPYAGSPRDALQGVGVRFMRDQVKNVTNADYNTHNDLKNPPPREGQWLDDIGTRDARITHARLVVTKPGASDHYPLVARIEI